jgi:hypothetical protein
MSLCTLTLLTIAAVSGSIGVVLLVRGGRQLQQPTEEFQAN